MATFRLYRFEYCQETSWWVELVNRSTARGLVILLVGTFIIGLTLTQFAVRGLSAIPQEVWIFLAVLAVSGAATYFLFLRLTSSGQSALAEFDRGSRVRSLQYKVSRFNSEVDITENNICKAMSEIHGGSRIHEVPQLKHLLAQHQRELTKARQELNTIWERSHGYI